MEELAILSWIVVVVVARAEKVIKKYEKMLQPNYEDSADKVKSDQRKTRSLSIKRKQKMKFLAIKVAK
jgi:hypothetical protein